MVYVFIVSLVTQVYWNYNMGGRIRKSQIAREQVREMGILLREAECQIDIGLFLDEYPRWELGAPHWSVILHKMFLHAAVRGQKEAEHMVFWGLLRQQIRTQPRGWSLCHGVSGIPDLPQGDPRYLPKCLFTKKATGSSLLWGSIEKENHCWYSLFPNRPIA